MQYSVIQRTHMGNPVVEKSRKSLRLGSLLAPQSILVF
jgi:hypothetical protein